jgi:hypothetical protein
MACNCKTPFINCENCSCKKTAIPTVLTAVASAEVEKMVDADMEEKDPDAESADSDI